MSDQNVQGTIKTRSGTWEWELTSLRAWPKSDVTGKRLGFEDPTNAVNAMSLELERLTNWSRGSYQSQEAWTAWGTAHFLIKEQGAALPAFLRELHRYRDEHDRTDNGDGTWQRVVGFEIALDVLQEMMERHFGADVLLEAGTYLGKGKAK